MTAVILCSLILPWAPQLSKIADPTYRIISCPGILSASQYLLFEVYTTFGYQSTDSIVLYNVHMLSYFFAFVYHDNSNEQYIHFQHNLVYLSQYRFHISFQFHLKIV